MNERLQIILDFLNRRKIRATYEAVAEVLNTPPQTVGKMLDERRSEASWIVNKDTGEPTGYSPDQLHVQLKADPHVIETGLELFRSMIDAAFGKPSRMNDRDFQNYQRILHNASSSSLTVMGFTLTFLASGLVGFYAITSSSGDYKWYWQLGLGVVMFLIVSVLAIVWQREHVLGKQSVNDLREAGVRFPETAKWTGVTAWMWRLIYGLSMIFWLVFIGFAMGKIHGGRERVVPANNALQTTAASASDKPGATAAERHR